MNNTLGLNPSDLKTLKDILARYEATFYAFGSRTEPHHHPFSDLDICVMEDIDLVSLRGELEDSNLPIKVDIHSFKDFSQDFFERIKPDFMRL